MKGQMEWTSELAWGNIVSWLVSFTLRRRVAFFGKLGGTADIQNIIRPFCGRVMFFYFRGGNF